MQYAFLEKLAKDGDITKSDRADIYNTCSGILTKAAGFQSPISGKKGWELFRKDLVELLPYAALAGGVYGAKKTTEGLASLAEIRKMEAIKAEIMRSHEAEGYHDKAEARFDEIVSIAPRIGTMPELAKRLVRDRLHSGFTSDEIQRMAQIQATYSPNSNDAERMQKKLLKKKASIPSEDLGRIAANVVKIMAEAGLGTSTAVKVAGLFGRTPMEKATTVAKNVLMTGAILSGFGTLVGLGAGTVNQSISAIKNEDRKRKLKLSFLEAMRRSDPSIEPLHANRDKAVYAFNTLTHFSPHVASDPEAARAFMLNLVNMDQGVQTNTIKELSEIEKNLKMCKPENPFLKGFGAGADMFGMKSMVGKSVDVLSPIVEHGSEQVREEMGY